jgi:hypothetical protein
METFKQFLIEDNIRTKKGTPIKRSTWGVGKDIGGFVYFHKLYLDTIPQDRQKVVWSAYNKMVEAVGHEPQFNIIKVSKKQPIVSFIHSSDFDYEPEPTVGQFININLDKNTLKDGRSNAIWHHKWLWVKDDYPAFDVEESKERSRRWLQMDDIDFKRIGNRDFWNQTVVNKLR